MDKGMKPRRVQKTGYAKILRVQTKEGLRWRYEWFWKAISNRSCWIKVPTDRFNRRVTYYEELRIYCLNNTVFISD